ncbi:MAG: hypothetical protein AB1609_18935 [Bacillota bacterium]
MAIVSLPWGRPLKRGSSRVVRRVTKAVCADRRLLEGWCREHRVPVAWIHRARSGLWHVDLWGRPADRVLAARGRNRPAPGGGAP